MFSRQCPCCNKSIAFKHIRQYRKNKRFDCPHCQQSLTVKFLDQLINSLLVGYAMGAILAKSTDLSKGVVITMIVFVVLMWQKYMDMFFSLTKAEDEW